MPNPTVPAAATGLPKSRRAAKPLLRFAIPLPPGRSIRDALEAQIEALIDQLDRMDPDPDLEENGDLEPSICQKLGCAVDAELDESDLEPSLGSLSANMSQVKWAGPDNFHAASDRELDNADDEDGGDAEHSLGWSNPLGAKVDGMCRLIVERRPDRHVRRAKAVTPAVTRNVTRDAAVRA